MPHLPFETAARHKVIYIYVISLCMLLGSVWAFVAQFQKLQGRQELGSAQQDVIQLCTRLVETVRQAEDSSQITVLQTIMDSLQERVGDLPRDHALRQSISDFLIHKSELLQMVTERLSPQHSLESIAVILDRYAKQNALDSIRLSFQVSDSSFVIQTPQTFWKRLAVAFKPQAKRDTIWRRHEHQTDTQVFVGNTSDRIKAIKEQTDQVIQNWDAELRRYEEKLSRNFQQSLPPQLALYLMDIQEKTLQAIEAETHRDQRWLQQQLALSLSLFLSLWIAIATLTLWALRDLRKSHAARIATEHAEEQTRQVMLTRQQIMLSIAHDIKTPLSSILGYVDLWKQSDHRPIPNDEIQSVQVSGHYILGMVQTLLSAAAIEQGKLRVESINFDINNLATELQALFAPLAQSKNLDFNVTAEARLIWCDLNKIKTVAINLISNAIKYTPKGHVLTEIHYKPNTKELSLKVSDSGIGMKPEQLQNMFEAFERDQLGIRLSEGNGLGLYVIKGICALMNAHINVESAPERGSSWEILFPIEDQPSNTPLARTFSQHSLVLVDDDPLLLKLMAKSLELSGHHCHTFLTFEELKQFIDEDHPWDWIISDWDLDKGHTGTEVLSYARAHRPKAQVAILSGIDRQADMEGLAEQANVIISKPLNFNIIQDLWGSINDSSAQSPSFSLLRELLEDDPIAIGAVLSEFNLSIDQQIAQLLSLLEQGSPSQIPACVHRLKGMFAQLEATRLCTMIQSIESWSAGNEPEHWETYIQELMVATLEFQKQIQDYLHSEASSIS